MRKIKFNPRILAKLSASLMALAMVFCLMGAVTQPVSAAGMNAPMLTSTGTDGILDDTLEVFTGIGDWLTTTIPSFMSMFYNESGLTYLGVLGVVGLGFSVIFLCIGIIQRFLRWG